MDVSLYQVTATPVERVLPRLLEKIQDAGKRALVLVESEEKVEQLSHILWTYAQQSFLVHGTHKDGRPEHQPIWLTSKPENLNNASILILVDGRSDMEIKSFDRCIDLFDGTQPSFLALAKNRQTKYEQDGHVVTYLSQDTAGRWTQA